ncbi:anti-sigma factor [Gordonia sp. ABSL11-1]|uniref:anti-sigma factor n=1 Tax=Gordonia sp. ABSL11-1 TaxID=3053924 RepID=UPI0025724695|nr:anti-sigma factor [Gordonia sp. ABSL11-1]MDL9944919.1 anti-sigma factor [Gordonia sp. ABSL11-1]
MPDTDWLDDHVELYAVDVLTRPEHDRVDRELESLTPVERRIYDGRIAETRSAMAELASSYALDAPITLRDRVLDHVFAAPPAAVAGTSPAIPESQSEVPVVEQDSPNVVPIDKMRGSRRWAGVAVAAAAAVVVALGAGVVIGRSTAPEPARPAVASDQQQVLDVLSAPDAQLSVGRLDDRRGTMSVVASRDRNQAVALLRDLRNPIPTDRDFQLWLVGKADNPVSAGLIPPSGEGSPALVDRLDGSTVLAVTIEPKGGSQQPTTPILAQISL